VALWWGIAVRSFRRHAAYPSAVAAGLFTNALFGCVRAWVLLAALAGRARLGGYDASQVVTFSFLTQGLIMATGGFDLGELPERIRTGDVAVDLHRPVDLQAWWLARDLGRAAFHLLTRGVGPVLIGLAVFHRLRWPTPTAAALLVPCLVLAVVVSFGIRYLWCLACFWLLDTRGVLTASNLVAMFLNGLLLPLVLFPGWLRGVALHLPWAMTMQVPADVWLGRAHGAGAARALALQVVWAAAQLGVGRLATRVALRKVVVQGG
jgi:ABC-2 type transport system permease protein